MCIMEVRAGQHTSTIAQACAHNASTIDRDLEMFRPLIQARGETAKLAKLDEAAASMHNAYQSLMEIFADEITAEIATGEHDHADHGSERLRHVADAAVIADAEAFAAHRHDRNPGEAQEQATDLDITSAMRERTVEAERHETR